MTINAVKLANHLSSDSFNLHKSIKKNESYNEVAPMGKPFPRILRISRFSETWLLTYLALVVPTVSAKPIFDTIDSFTFTREYVLNSRGKVSNVKVSNIRRSYVGSRRWNWKSGKSIFEIRIPNFCYIQVIVFDQWQRLGLSKSGINDTVSWKIWKTLFIFPTKS